MSGETIRTAPDSPDWVKSVCSDEALPRPLCVNVHDLGSKADRAPVDVDADAKRVGLWLCVGAVLVAVLMTVAFGVFGGGPDPAPVATHRAIVAAQVVSAAPTTDALPTTLDAAVPFTAATASCGPGSTSPQALTDTSTDSAWVCARGTQESLVDGQVLHVSFTCGQARPESACSYMLHSVSVTPGWLAKTVGGSGGDAQWLAHRVVTRLQFNFFNGAALAADPFFVDTNSVHGPVTATLPARVLASHVDVLVLHTDRPPADTTATATETPSPTETSDDPSTLTDPVDATFAMSQLQFVGHAPN